MKKIVAILLALPFILAGCRKTGPDYPKPEKFDSVMVLFSEGFNNLSSKLARNIDDLCRGEVPFEWEPNAILVFAHSTLRDLDYNTPNAPALYRLVRKGNGNVIRDTLAVYDPNMVSASPETLSEVLNYVRTNFPAETTGMIYSSHGTGWIPSDAASIKMEKSIWTARYGGHTATSTGFGFLHDECPEFKSIGHQERPGADDAFSIDIDNFAAAIPFKLDYIILDACLMGGIETAWALKDKCRYLSVSPTEILSPGYFIYNEMPGLLLRKEPDVKGVAQAYYNYYSKVYGTHSVSVTLLDCSRIEGLLNPVRDFVSAHREVLNSLDYYSLQSFYTGGPGWSKYERCFIDLIDMVDKAGASGPEYTAIDAALKDCIIYKACTPYYNGVPIKCYCGLSMYLPGDKDYAFDSDYKDISWNKVCGVVL